MKLRILGFDVPVIYQEDFTREHNKRGHFDQFLFQIKVCKDIPEQVQFECLLHEIMEIINQELVLGLKHDEQLSKVATGLFQVLSDNKAEFRRLLK